ncbi:MAG: HIT domain-containing protein [Candidatus Pacebacteria bacterium]|nr:HIT domain-containing protein [Candidatus Paceibacterota bacterium]
MENCLFCNIIEGNVPSTKVYEDEHVYAFLDINPINVGHTLVIPKEHCADIHDIPEDTLQHIMSVVKKLSTAIKKSTELDGINISMNNGKAAGQIIFHSHIHIIPRFEKDGFEPWKSKREYKEGEAAKIAERIQEELL